MKYLKLKVLALITAATFFSSALHAQYYDPVDTYDYGWGDGYDQQQWWNPADWFDDTPDSFNWDYDNSWDDYDWYGEAYGPDRYDYDWNYSGYPYHYWDHDYTDNDYGYDYDYGHDGWYDDYDYDADDNGDQTE